MSHTVEILSVGTELLLGNIVNLDAQILSQGLSALGLNVYWHTVVGDNPQRAREAVAAAKGRADIIITTGGLGPTCDDLTKNVLAEAFGKKLVFHEPSAQRIRNYFARTGRPMTENNLQQAMLPEGCTVLVNDWGTAPGCAFQAEGCHVIMLPGPPSECRPMFQHRVVPYLQALSEGVIASHTLKLFGIGESQMEAQLRDEMNAMSNPTLAPYAKEGECELRVTAKAPTMEQAQALLLPKVEELKARFGTRVYGVDVSSLEEVVEDLLREKGLTLGCAESITGGLMAKRLTDLPGASRIFRGGIVSYTNEVKAGVLAAKENSTLPVFVSMTYERSGRTLSGCDPLTMVNVLEGLGVDALGVNCSLGPDELGDIMEEVLSHAHVPVFMQPNAGLPHLEHGVTCYAMDAQQFAQRTVDYAQRGVSILGGCCGTTPQGIALLRQKMPKMCVRRDNPYRTIVSSGVRSVCIGDQPVVCGERLNPTGKKKLKQALLEERYEDVRREGVLQDQAGAQVLDVNVGVPGIDEQKVMPKVIAMLQEVLTLPLQIDTSDPQAMEAACRRYNGRPLMNSVNGKQETMEQIFPIAKKYGGVVIGLTLDEEGIPDTAEKRVAIAQRIIDTARSYGIPSSIRWC